VKLEPPSAAPAAVVEKPLRKPGSATCCMVLSILSFLGGAVSIAMMLTVALPGGEMFAIGGFATGVFWWALGDIVYALERIARK
jgi:succinate-acetate transporter protein